MIKNREDLLLEIRNFLYKERINGLKLHDQIDAIDCRYHTMQDLNSGYYVNHTMSKVLLYIIKKGGVISEKGIEIHS